MKTTASDPTTLLPNVYNDGSPNKTFQNSYEETRPNRKALLDRLERYIAALVTRFKNLVTLAAMPAGEDATKEIAAAHALQMEVETKALVGPVIALGSR